MDFTPLLGFAAVSLTLALTPGADWAYTISAGLRERSAAPSIAGLCTGYVAHTALVAAGLGVLLAARADIVAWLSVAGALYLLWLGVTTARSWRGAGYRAADAPTGGAAGGAFADFLRGAGTSGINPKGLLLFLASCRSSCVRARRSRFPSRPWRWASPTWRSPSSSMASWPSGHAACSARHHAEPRS
ncbi:LysE family translocator [Sinomonas gamaensis]|uniref:LysE family translocator n=1 Tax=Sinomonas gamaensis TaxID=2565624 RepID=UPI00308450CB